MLCSSLRSALCRFKALAVNGRFLARAYDLARNVGTRQITVTVDKGVQ